MLPENSSSKVEGSLKGTLFGSFPSLWEAKALLSSIEGIGHWIEASSRSDQLRLVTYRQADLFPPSIRRFVIQNKIVVAYPLRIFSVIVALGVRALASKAFMVYGRVPCFYTAGSSLKERAGFVFGTPILLSEGVVDAESLSRFYPHSWAYLTATVSGRQAQILSCFTNQVILVPDNDSSGQRGVLHSKRVLQKYGVRADVVNLPQSVKDPGDLLLEESSSANAIIATEIAMRVADSLGERHKEVSDVEKERHCSSHGEG